MSQIYPKEFVHNTAYLVKLPYIAGLAVPLMFVYCWDYTTEYRTDIHTEEISASVAMSQKISSKIFNLLEMFTNSIRVKVVKFDEQGNIEVINKIAV